MERFTKVVVLESEVEAERVAGVLSNRGIPHVMRSYHDSAYDGIFQGMKGWGHIEAPLGYHDQIRDIVTDISESAADQTDNQPEDDEDSR